MSDVKQVIDKLEVMDKRLDNIDITLTKQAKDLEYHILRTNILQDKIQPIEKHVIFINNATKIIIAIGSFIGFCAMIYAAIK